MAFCGSATLWVKIAFICAVIALILDICGFATPSWMVYQITTNSVRVGLWSVKACVGTSCSTSGTANSSFETDQFIATQAFEIIALVLFIIAPFVIGVYVFAANTRGRCLAITCMIICFSATFFCIVGMICWLVYIPSPYVSSYSMGLTVLAAILAFIAGLLFVPDTLDKVYDDY